MIMLISNFLYPIFSCKPNSIGGLLLIVPLHNRKLVPLKLSVDKLASLSILDALGVRVSDNRAFLVRRRMNSFHPILELWPI